MFRPGVTRCSICGEVISSSDPHVAFSHFVPNTHDRLIRFSGSIMHRSCFDDDPDSVAAWARWSETVKRLGPAGRVCAVCRDPVRDPDDHLTLGHLTEAEGHPLFRYNYTHLHRSHIWQWDALPEVVSNLETLDESDAWGGDSLKRLIDELRQHVW